MLGLGREKEGGEIPANESVLLFCQRFVSGHGNEEEEPEMPQCNYTKQRIGVCVLVCDSRNCPCRSAESPLP